MKLTFGLTILIVLAFLYLYIKKLLEIRKRRQILTPAHYVGNNFNIKAYNEPIVSYTDVFLTVFSLISTTTLPILVGKWFNPKFNFLFSILNPAFSFSILLPIVFYIRNSKVRNYVLQTLKEKIKELISMKI